MARVAASTSPGRRAGARIAVLALIALVIGARAAALMFDHSLHSIDGVLQTWFALEGFAGGGKLGAEFQSYLGVTMILALVPLYAGLGGTLYASTLAATAAVVAGAFGMAYAIAWASRIVPARQRWAAALVLVFVFHVAGRVVVEAAGYRYPLDFDPGVSLRAVRALLPVLVLPVFVACLRAAFRGRELTGGALLGLASGAGLLWSNDAGPPLVIAVVAALVSALYPRPLVLARMLGAWALGLALSAALILAAVTHGDPAGWLAYNFRDVAGDQFWYFGPWDRETRVLGFADLRFIATSAMQLSGASLGVVTMLLLAICVVVAFVRRLRGRGAPVRMAGFIMLGAATLGTALVPQLGGHVDPGYAAITFMLGASAPLIVFRRAALRRAKGLARALAGGQIVALGAAAGLALAGAEIARTASIVSASDRTVYAEELGFFVTREFHADLRAMRQLAKAWDADAIPQDRRLLSVYTSALDIAAGTNSPTPVGSLIHALGPANRAQFTALVERREVAAVTTIAPDYSGWEAWNTRANWPFFKALRENYRPLARNGQHVVWVNAKEGQRPFAKAECRVVPVSASRLKVEVYSLEVGHADVKVERTGPFATHRSAMLTVHEQSPFTRATREPLWGGYPRYGIANKASLSLFAPVEPSMPTTLTLEVLDGSPIGAATCSARVYPLVEYAVLPGLVEGIADHVEGAAR
jgi:hypothetical protein